MLSAEQSVADECHACCADIDLEAVAAAQSVEAGEAIASLGRAKKLVESATETHLAVEKAL